MMGFSFLIFYALLICALYQKGAFDEEEVTPVKVTSPLGCDFCGESHRMLTPIDLDDCKKMICSDCYSKLGDD